MSVKVELGQLSDALAEYTYAYLVSVGDDYRPRIVAVAPELRDGLLHVSSVGNSTRANVAAHPEVTLMWPPREPGGLTLIVDGVGECAAARFTLRPNQAVLHRNPFSG